MEVAIWWLALVLALLGFASVAFIWLIVRINRMSPKSAAPLRDGTETSEALAREDIEHIFNNEFREELRNMGRLYFQKIINENAMFLQQDLRLTGSQINDYMKSEIQKHLQEEFAKYEQSVKDAQTLAIEAIQRTASDAEAQREQLATQLNDEVEKRKTLIIENFEKNMADVVNHYLVAAIGNQIDVNAQLDFILSELSENKEAILEDVKR